MRFYIVTNDRIATIPAQNAQLNKYKKQALNSSILPMNTMKMMH
ncbi:hypothetical protein [Pseudoalteromonas sp. Ld20]